MTIKRLLIVAVVLVFAQTASGQFGQSARLNDLARQLANEAGSLAESNYLDYTRGFRNSRADVESLMASQQFSAGAQLFSRMVNDRRRNSELRDAFQVLQQSWRSADRSNLRNNRFDLQRLMSDIESELNSGTSGNNNPGPFPFPDSSRSGRMTWRGRVDDDVRILIRGGTAQVETIGGTPYYDAVTSFSSSLPPRRVTVRLQKNRGRGEVFIEQQPSRENDFTAVIRVRDPRGGASDYDFEVSW
jgi:type II secretory pathway pseudopilin PulG